MKLRLLILGLVVMVSISGCAGKRRQQYINSHPDLSEEIKQSILSRNIVKGMNKGQAILSLGKPNKKDTYANYFGITEIWTYGDCISKKCSILYFDNQGRLVYFSRYRSE
jgi:outer membrane protein assembly factor BamE (lipoprotein component of BamABCDE complex)